jgi:hypothetical protein
MHSQPLLPGLDEIQHFHGQAVLRKQYSLLHLSAEDLMLEYVLLIREYLLFACIIG